MTKLKNDDKNDVLSLFTEKRENVPPVVLKVIKCLNACFPASKLLKNGKKVKVGWNVVPPKNDKEITKNQYVTDEKLVRWQNLDSGTQRNTKKFIKDGY